MAASASTGLPRRSRARTALRLLLLFAGLGSIVAGVLVIALPLLGVAQRGSADNQALQQWNNGGSNALAGAGASAPSTHSCGSGGAADYALVSFPSLSRYGYAGVAGDGTWDDLHTRSMVHYTTSPAPGQQGNVIVAFHREPNYEHIDQLKVGDTVTVQDRGCRQWQYRITATGTKPPSAVSELAPTSGHELTLITCTPYWVDTDRIVWRAELIGS